MGNAAEEQKLFDIKSQLAEEERIRDQKERDVQATKELLEQHKQTMAQRIASMEVRAYYHPRGSPPLL